MSELDYRVWYQGGLWFWDVYGSAITPLAQGAALSSAAARAEAMTYAMRASESDSARESCRLARETARKALANAHERHNTFRQRIPELAVRATRTLRMIGSSREMIEQSRRLLGHRQSAATLQKTLEEAEQAVLLSRVHVECQLAVIDHLERHNLDASEAGCLLDAFLDDQLEAEAQCEMLRAKLKEQLEPDL